MSLAAPRPTFSPALQRFRRSHEFWLLAVILALCLALSLATDSFLTLQNLFDLLTSNAFVGILASGLLVVLIAGGIDISFTATASVAQYVTLTLAIRYGLGWFAMFAIAGAIGVACGAINALFITQAAHLVDHRLDRHAQHFLWPADFLHPRKIHHVSAEILSRRDLVVRIRRRQRDALCAEFADPGSGPGLRIGLAAA